MSELGVFCGTFNPIHWGHLLMAECARDQFKLEKVLLITSPNPPHRNQDLLDAEDRFELVQLAASENPHFQASRIELDRSGPSYTVDTLRQIKDEYPQANLNFIVGEDNLPMLSQWHESEVLFKICRLLIAPRATAYDDSSATPPDISCLPPLTATGIIDFPHVPISASNIRDRVRAGKSILYMVPVKVNNVILERHYYQMESKQRR
jgi:nicotinate-nucleotide adenylyltransferase